MISIFRLRQGSRKLYLSWKNAVRSINLASVAMQAVGLHVCGKSRRPWRERSDILTEGLSDVW